MRVQEEQANNQVLGELSHCGFGQLLVLLDECVQCAAWTVLEDEPEVVAGFVPVVELQDVDVV